MPELRINERMAHAELSGSGFFIRRVVSPASMAAGVTRRPSPRLVPSSVCNKENNIPPWAVRPAQRRRSPLPEWYPRRPLADITTIVKAIERKSRLRDAAARQQSQRPEQSPKSGDPATPAPVEHCVPPCAPAQNCLAASLIQSELKVSFSPSDCSLQTPSRPIDPALADRIEKELSNSIEQLEKIVRRNSKRTATSKAAAQSSKRAMQRRTLMSMR